MSLPLYTPDRLPYWIGTARRQRDKDRAVIKRILKSLVPGTVLEIGAGVGQLSELLKAHGRTVIASDVADFFVEYMLGRGLDARRVDALDISASVTGVANILAQGLSPMVSKNEDLVEQTYASIYAALIPGGRVVAILPIVRGDEFNSIGLHRRLLPRTGFRIVEQARDQAFPSIVYGWPPRAVVRIAENVLGPRIGIRWIIVAERPDTPRTATAQG